MLEALEIVCVLTVVSFQLLLGDCQYFFKARSTSLPPVSPPAGSSSVFKERGFDSRRTANLNNKHTQPLSLEAP